MEVLRTGAQRASIRRLRSALGLAVAVAGLALTTVATVAAVTPTTPSTVISTSRAALCDGISARTAATTAATRKVTVAAGTIVTVTATVTGGTWRASCDGRTFSGSTWYRISRINGRAVSSLYGVASLYAASGLFKSARVRVAVACDGAVLRSAASTSATRTASAQVLAIAPAVAHIVMCEEIRDEILEKFAEHLAWSRAQVLARYGPVLDAAHWIRPVAEAPHHLKMVSGDGDDTVFVRVAEAIYSEISEIIGPDQIRYIVTANTSDFPPGAAYAGFLFGTAHTALLALDVEPAED